MYRGDNKDAILVLEVVLLHNSCLVADVYNAFYSVPIQAPVELWFCVDHGQHGLRFPHFKYLLQVCVQLYFV